MGTFSISIVFTLTIIGLLFGVTAQIQRRTRGPSPYVQQRKSYHQELKREKPYLTYDEIATASREALGDPTISVETVRNDLRGFRWDDDNDTTRDM